LLALGLTECQNRESLKEQTENLAMRQFNALTLTVAHCLEGKEREKTIRDTGRGGGPSPHRHALDAVRRWAYGREDKRNLVQELERIDDEVLSEQSADRFVRMTHMLEGLDGHYVERPLGYISGPNGIVRIKARPHISLETGAVVTHVIFWNNKTATINDNESRFAATTFHKALPADILHRDRYLIIDVNNDVYYRISHEKSNSSAAEVEDFIAYIERILSNDR
jgi:hypothetical protein